jgi:hypothetical protein
MADPAELYNGGLAGQAVRPKCSRSASGPTGTTSRPGSHWVRRRPRRSCRTSFTRRSWRDRADHRSAGPGSAPVVGCALRGHGPPPTAHQASGVRASRVASGRLATEPLLGSVQPGRMVDRPATASYWRSPTPRGVDLSRTSGSGRRSWSRTAPTAATRRPGRGSTTTGRAGLIDVQHDRRARLGPAESSAWATRPSCTVGRLTGSRADADHRCSRRTAALAYRRRRPVARAPTGSATTLRGQRDSRQRYCVLRQRTVALAPTHRRRRLVVGQGPSARWCGTAGRRVSKRSRRVL